MVSRFMGAAIAVASMGLAFLSCERIFDDLDPCPHGVSLRFIYDYNMEYANAFPKKVDCLTLLIYDVDGDYVGSRTVTGEELRDESYRMNIDLADGTYNFVAYGGMACGQSSFKFVGEAPGEGTQDGDIRVALDADISKDIGKRLHDLFWGRLSLKTADMYSEGTVELMKNTNNIRIVLQQMNGLPVDDKLFDFRLTDDNTLFDSNNDLIPAGTATYIPWERGQKIIGVTTENKDVIVAYAEFSTSRLMKQNTPRLVISRVSDGNTVIDIPLVNYLMMLRSELYKDMEKQEFLDRQSEWEMIFFLDDGLSWNESVIKINDWTVRINDTEF